MAKTTAAKTKSNVIPVRPPTAPTTGSATDLMRRYAGMGTSTAASENLVPMLRVLQSNSPQCQKKNPAYINGAEAGDILLKGTSDPLVKGEEGFVFQPCHFYFDWILWRPRDAGGGFMGRAPGDADHPPKGAVKEEDDDGKVSWKDSDGNDWMFTRYWTGFVIGHGAPMPFVIPLTSTGHTVSRSWMFAANNILIPGTTDKAPLFGAEWLIKSKHRSNASGDWYVLDPQIKYVYGSDPKRVKEDLAAIERGHALMQAFTSGEKRMEDPDAPIADAVAGEPDDGAM